jgi:hypothetical protein
MTPAAISTRELPTDDAKNGATHRDGARDLATAIFARLPTL